MKLLKATFALPLLLCTLALFQILAPCLAQDSVDDSSSPDNGTTTTNTTTHLSPLPHPSVNLTDPPKSLLDSMYITTSKPALSSQITTTVFTARQLIPPFNSCTLETALLPISTAPSDNVTLPCYLDDAYNGELSFQLTFTSDTATVKAALSANPPQVLTSEAGKSIAYPTFIPPPDTDDPTSIDESSNSVILSVRYNCRSNVQGVIPISLTLHFGDADNTDDVTIVWQKICRNGPNDKMDYGYLTGDENMGSEGLYSFGQDTSAMVTVGASDESTEFYMKLLQPGAQQVFMAPYITSSFSDIVSITIRGNHPQGGIVEGLMITKLQVGYECHRKGEATIEATVAIPPFQNISAVWKKDCGGNIPSNIQVGTDEDGFDIVDSGEPTPKYMVGIDNIGTDHSEEHMHLPGNQTEWIFFIKNGDTIQDGDEPHRPESDTALIIGRISATIENPTVVYPVTPIVMTRTTMKWKQVSKSGSHSSYPLHTGESIKVIMPMLCRMVGKESRVLITVPVLGYTELEFGVAKECTHVGVAHKSSQFVVTVGTVFWFGALIVLAGLVYLYYRRKHQKGGSFTAVPLHEQP